MISFTFYIFFRIIFDRPLTLQKEQVHHHCLHVHEYHSINIKKLNMCVNFFTDAFIYEVYWLYINLLETL